MTTSKTYHVPAGSAHASSSRKETADKTSGQGTGVHAVLLVSSPDQMVPQAAPLTVVVDLRECVFALDRIRLPESTPMPSPTGGKSRRAGTRAAHLTLVIGPDHLRIRVERHGLRAEATVALLEPASGVGEVAFHLADAALFRLLAKRDLAELEYMGRSGESRSRSTVTFVLDAAHSTLAVGLGRARFRLAVANAEPPAPLELLPRAGGEGTHCDPRDLSAALVLASTFRLAGPQSERQAASNLNMISCSTGTVRGGTAAAFTMISGPLLEPYEFSIHRRDAALLSPLLRRTAGCTYRAGGKKIQFETMGHIVEVDCSPTDFPDYARNIAEFDAVSADYPTSAADMTDAVLSQSLVQVVDSVRHPLLTTLAVGESHDHSLFLRTRSADGRNEARSAVPVGGSSNSPEPAYISVAIRDLLRALAIAQPGSHLSLKALKTTLSIAIAEDERTVRHFLGANARPPLRSCRFEDRS